MDTAMEKMGWVFIVYLILGYWYAVLSLVFTWNQFDNYQKTCSTLWQCTLTVWNEGMKSDGIADAMRQTLDHGYSPLASIDQGQTWQEFGGIILWLSYYVFVPLVMLVIFSSIIIDVFGQTRDESSAHDKQKKNSCFICGLKIYPENENDVHFKNSQELEHHTSISDKWDPKRPPPEHCVDDYIAYFMFLYSKQALGDCTPQQDYVLQRIKPPAEQPPGGELQSLEINFFPMDQSMSLQRSHDQSSATESNKEEAEVQQLIHHVRKVHDDLQQVVEERRRELCGK